MEMTGDEGSKGEGWSARGRRGESQISGEALGHLARCTGRSLLGPALQCIRLRSGR